MIVIAIAVLGRANAVINKTAVAVEAIVLGEQM
jgi:hypothetical protein